MALRVVMKNDDRIKKSQMVKELAGILEKKWERRFRDQGEKEFAKSQVMNTDVVLTSHQVDDDRLSPDEAMDAFRQNFRAALSKAWVSEDGRLMKFSGFRSESLCRSFERDAKNIIKSLALPLEVNIEVWSRNDFIFDIALEIKYVNR